MNRSIAVLGAAQIVAASIAVSSVLWSSDRVFQTTAWTFALFTAALLLLTLLPPIYIELRRHGSWITPADGAFVIGLFVLGPLGFVLAVALAEVVVTLRVRQPIIKRVFNLITMVAGSAVGAAVFGAFGRSDPLDPVAWLGAFLALSVIAAWDVLVGALVLAISEREPITSTMRSLAPAVAVNLVVAAPLGLIALLLLAQTGPGVLLIAPVMLVLHASARALSRQQTERDRFQQLYTASSNLAQLVGVSDMLTLVAREARTIETGTAAVACIVHDDGSVDAMFVDDDGASRAAPSLSRAVLSVADGDQGQAAAGPLSRTLRRDLPAFATMNWASRAIDDTGRLIVVVFRDFTADGNEGHRSKVLAAFVSHAASTLANVRLHVEVQRALEQERLLNEQKGEFVATVSHELRTPLASMSGAMQTLRRLGKRVPETDRDELVGLALEQGDRLKALIEDLLVVAAADHHGLEVPQAPVRLPDLVDSLQREFAPRLTDGLRTHLDVDVTTVLSNEDKLRRILSNLLENARKYAPDATVELGISSRDGQLDVAVSDDGPGIPEDQRERIFERFVQLDQSSTRQQGGTGLGLHLSRQLAHKLGGELWAEAADGGGARFVLRLPLVAVDGPLHGQAEVGAPPTHDHFSARYGRSTSIQTNPTRLDGHVLTAGRRDGR